MALSFITPTSRLEKSAAGSYKRARKAGLPSGINSSYRSRAEQQRLYDGWIRRLPGFNQAAPPGYSKHEKGLALDLPLAARGWMQKHGQRYGWHRTNDEPWHFEYDVTRDRVRTQVSRVNAVNKALGWRKWKADRERIKAAQRLLASYGLYGGKIDGLPGPLTQKAWAALNAAAK